MENIVITKSKSAGLGRFMPGIKGCEEMYTVSELSTARLSKSELFTNFTKVAGITFDYALPQQWLNAITAFCSESQEFKGVSYSLISGTCVWTFDGIISRCVEVEQAINAYHERCYSDW